MSGKIDPALWADINRLLEMAWSFAWAQGYAACAEDRRNGVIRSEFAARDAHGVTARWRDPVPRAAVAPAAPPRECPHCGCPYFYKMPSRPGMFRCQNCRADVSPKSVSPFRYGKLPMESYARAIEIHRAGGRTVDIMRALKITYKAAWDLRERIKAQAPD